LSPTRLRLLICGQASYDDHQPQVCAVYASSLKVVLILPRSAEAATSRCVKSVRDVLIMMDSCGVSEGSVLQVRSTGEGAGGPQVGDSLWGLPYDD